MGGGEKKEEGKGEKGEGKEQQERNALYRTQRAAYQRPETEGY